MAVPIHGDQRRSGIEDWEISLSLGHDLDTYFIHTYSSLLHYYSTMQEDQKRPLTETEKSFLGLPYSALGQELMKGRLRARKYLKAYNVTVSMKIQCQALLTIELGLSPGSVF